MRIPLRDNTVLLADLYRPDTADRLPTAVRRTPYGRSGAPGGRSVDGLRLVRAGYNLLVQSTRGRDGSDGAFRPFATEREDGADTLDWVAAQPWCDGRTALFGRSYEGMAALLAAPDSGCGAVAAQVAPGSRAGATRSGGAFQLGFCLHWVLCDLVLPELAAGSAAAAEVIAALDDIDRLYADPGAALELLDRCAPYYRDWLEEPAVAAEPAAGPPLLSIGGWYDIFLADGLAARSRRPELSTLVVGPWSHCVTGGIFPQRRYGHAADEDVVDITALHIAHFDRALKGRDTAPGAPVRLFVTGADEWRDFPCWPVPGTTDQAVHLAGRGRAAEGDGRLLPEPAEPASDQLRHDPAAPVPTCGGATLMTGMFVGADCGPLDQRDVERHPHVLRYTGDRLHRPLTVIGEVRVVLGFAATTPDADLAAKLVDVHPDGRAELLCDGVLRARHRDPGAPAGLEPGRITELAVRLGAVAHRFGAGHRIRLDLAASNFPRFDLDPALAAGVVGAVHHGGAHGSCLVLPVAPD
ncbi:CocE/NonD family hydrolase [Saccharopolyspora gregorii]|uniref:CocE/NonD family hydrolase n=1 Tax=Saccharopolyspora gregorii TaxID=33914 RepID=A0ABP6RQK9_9PSEU